MAQKKPVRSLDSLSNLLSEEQKKAFKLDEEKREKQHKKALEAVKGLAVGLDKKKLPDNEFNAKYDSLKAANEPMSVGTDKEGDYIIHKNVKYCRSEEIKPQDKQAST